MPWYIGLALSTVSVAEAVHIEFALKQPQTQERDEHDERFIRHVNILLSVVSVYMILEAVSPLVHAGFQRLFASRIIDIGLYADYLLLWGAATSCVIPLELLRSSEGIPMDRVALIWLHLGLACIVVLRAASFVLLLRRLDAHLDALG